MLHRPGFVNVDEDGVVRDGGIVRVNMMMADAARDARRYYTKDVGRACLQSHISKLRAAAADLQGRLDSEAAEEEEAEGKNDVSDHAMTMRDAQAIRDQAYSDYVQRLQTAWMTPAKRLHDAAASKLESDKDDPEEAREEAYQKRKKALSNAWKQAKTQRAKEMAEAIERLGERWRGGA
jgi:hypothetical protein